MVGDGLYDAPTLAAAHASLSPISAVDLAQAQADAVFLVERLRPVVDTLVTARRARRLMLQNLGLAVIYNAVSVPIAIASLVTPLIATVVAMSGSSLLVTLNALRVRLPEKIKRAETRAQTRAPLDVVVLAAFHGPQEGHQAECERHWHQITKYVHAIFSFRAALRVLADDDLE